MRILGNLFEKNQAWAEHIHAEDPSFFQQLAQSQSPEYLWIGCADSRVPANEIVGLMPGELFVHRNIANLVIHTDMNCLSVIQFAVEVLKVKHIIVCGHYGCGGVRMAMENTTLGVIDNWLLHIKDVYVRHEDVLEVLEGETERLNRLCELNVIEQVHHVCHTPIVQKAWQLGQELSVHGWIYGMEDGRLQDLQVTIEKESEISSIYRYAVSQQG
ncbi:MAG: carbonate dehydratase [bacterium]|nr:carbonate dehydratase [bacterium]